LEEWDSCGWRFAVSADMGRQLRKVIEELTEEGVG